MESSHQTVT